MVHGDCSSRGCYAMTDEQIQEIFALARESFDGGQLAFQVQAFPFRMTAKNMARHRKNPHMAFWRMLKEGNDHFELSKEQPKIDVCERRYVFNGHLLDPSQLFDPKGPCPSFQVPNELARAVAERSKSDDREIALLARLLPAAPIVTGRDGGTHQAFAGGAPGRPSAVPPAVEDANALVASGRTGGEVVTGSTSATANVPPPPNDPRRSTAASGSGAVRASLGSMGGITRGRTSGATPPQPESQPVAQPEPAPQPQTPQPLPGAVPIRSTGGFSYR
jgi:hypothetical protein